VTLTGFVPDEELVDHYNLCDVFAMPSKGEGFGIVYLEALACGKPTLGGNKDGAIDALCQGELGILVDPDDPNAIAQSLIQILQGTHPHPILYQPEVLRQKVIETFGFERFKQTLARLMQSSD
jgi:glycosyltransferase involved in cell wall biosynthesis